MAAGRSSVDSKGDRVLLLDARFFVGDGHFQGVIAGTKLLRIPQKLRAFLFWISLLQPSGDDCSDSRRI